MEALVRGITVYMIVIEGTLALTGARFILRYLKEADRLPGLPRRLHPRQPRRVAPRRLRGQVPRRRDQGGRALQAGRPGDARRRRCPVGVLAFSPDWVENRYDFDTPFYHSKEMFEYAMKSLSKKLAAMGMAPSAARRRRLERPRRRGARARARPGPARRPTRRSGSSRPRYEVLKRDGYAGLTTAKVAAASGQNKALISYYFGSKQGLVAAVARAGLGDDHRRGPRPGRRAARRRASWSRRSTDGRLAGDGPRPRAAARLLRPRLAGGGRARGRRDHDRDEAGPSGDPARAAARARPAAGAPSSTGSRSTWSPGSRGSRSSASTAATRPALARAREIFVDVGDGGDRAPLALGSRAPCSRCCARRSRCARRRRCGCDCCAGSAGSVAREFAVGALAAIAARDRGRWSRSGALDGWLGIAVVGSRSRSPRCALARLAWQSLTSARAVREALAELEPPADERALATSRCSHLLFPPLMLWPRGRPPPARGRVRALRRPAAAPRRLRARRGRRRRRRARRSSRSTAAAGSSAPAPSRASRCSTTSPRHGWVGFNIDYRLSPRGDLPRPPRRRQAGDRLGARARRRVRRRPRLHLPHRRLGRRAPVRARGADRRRPRLPARVRGRRHLGRRRGPLLRRLRPHRRRGRLLPGAARVGARAPRVQGAHRRRAGALSRRLADPSRARGRAAVLRPARRPRHAGPGRRRAPVRRASCARSRTSRSSTPSSPAPSTPSTSCPPCAPRASWRRSSASWRRSAPAPSRSCRAAPQAIG